MYSKVRMGMIGGGQGAFIGAVHRMAGALDGRIELVCASFSQNYENTKITGACESISEKRLYVSWQEMLDRELDLPEYERMEFISIVTPNHLHMPIAKAAAEKGFHIICDKPAGMSYDEVAGLAPILTSSGSIFALTHTYLGYPMVWQARHLLEKGTIGKLKKIYVEYPQGWLAQELEASGNKQAGWRNDPAKAGLAGAMGDIGTHAHSLVEFISAQSMIRVSAHLRSHFKSRQLDDDGVILFEMDDEVTGVLTASQICAGEENSLKIRLYGSKGGLEWSQMEPNSLKVRQSGQPMQIFRAGLDQSLCTAALERTRLPSGHPEGYLEAFANLYRQFAAAVRNNESLQARGVPGLVEALSGMAFLEAVVASNAQNNMWVEINNNVPAQFQRLAS